MASTTAGLKKDVKETPFRNLVGVLGPSQQRLAREGGPGRVRGNWYIIHYRFKQQFHVLQSTQPMNILSAHSTELGLLRHLRDSKFNSP